jgi:hypothetical protein
MPAVPDISISPELRAGADVLERGSESIRAVTAGEQNRFARAFDALNQLALASGTPLAIVGGLAAIHFGYPAVTGDIDIVVARDALDRLFDVAPQFGFKVKWRSKVGWHTLQFEDVEINIVPEEGKARDSAPTTIPGLTKLGVASSLGYSNLPGWIELKLSSGPTKDRTHIVVVLKTLASDRISEIRRHASGVHSRYGDLLDQLIEEANEEKRQESDRGKQRE